MVRGVHGEVVLGGEVNEDLRDLVDEIVVVFCDGVSFDERVEGDEVGLASGDGGFERGGERSGFGAASTVDGEELSGLGSGR
jgi:hypothetical protein